MVVEQRLHDRLAVVKGSLDRQRMDVAGTRCRHHPPLHLGDAPVREQHDQIDIFQPGERLDRGTAGIARGRDHDRGTLRTLRQHVIHQPRDQLHRDVLERQRRTMKQLEQEFVRSDLVERNHGRMAESGVGLVRHAAEIGIGYLAGGKRPDHLDRDFPIGPAKETGDGLARELRPGLGHVETAVAGKPGQHHVTEAQHGGLAPGRNIPRQTALQRPKPPLKPLIFLEFIEPAGGGLAGTIMGFSRDGKCRDGKKVKVRDLSSVRRPSGVSLLSRGARRPSYARKNAQRNQRAQETPGALGTRSSCALVVSTR